MSTDRRYSLLKHKHAAADLLSDSLSAGDVLYVNNDGDLAILPAGDNTDVLSLSGGLPAWTNSTGGGVVQLVDLSDVNSSTATNRNVLVADGVDWESRALTEADISDLGTYLTAESESGIETALTSTAAFTVNNYVFNTDQTVGAGQDNYVLTYDNATGEIGLEAATGGASQLTDLSDVSTAATTDKFALMANGSAYVGRAIVEADISDLGTYLTAAADETVTGAWTFQNSGGVVIADAGGTDTATFSHDGTDFDLTLANTTDWNVSGATGNIIFEGGIGFKFNNPANTANVKFDVNASPNLNITSTSVVNSNMIGFTGWWLRDGAWFRISDSTDADYLQFSHDGTDFNIAGTNTTDINITGITDLVVANYRFNAAETVGAGQDNYVLTYDNGTGKIGLEAATGGGASQLSDLSDVNTSTPTNRNALVADGVDWESRALVEADISDLGTYLTDITGEALSTLSDVTITTIASGELLKWNGSAWVNNTLAEAGIQPAGSYLTDITGEALSTLSDVTITAIASGELLKWNGSAWVNNTLAEAGIAAASHSHATTDITSGTFADARIAESNVTQHEAALTLTESQVESALTTAAAFTVNNYVFNADQTVGAGQDNYVLTYDNATGEIGLEVAPGAGGGIDNVVEDTTPQLGGDLDAQSNSINTLASLTMDGTLTVQNSTNTDSIAISHDGTDANVATTNTTDVNFTGASGLYTFDSDISLLTGSNIRAYNPAGTAYAEISVNATPNLNITGSGVTNFNLLGYTNVWFRDGLTFRISDTTDNDYMEFDHDGTDFNMSATNTTDLNLTGITALQAGTVDADFDAITATSYGGITEGNLLDKTANETVTGTWQFDGNITLTNTQPRFITVDSDAPADRGTSLWRHQGSTWGIYTATDAAPTTKVQSYIEATRSGTTVTSVTLGEKYKFNVDETVGAGQDNYVLTYDNGTGEIGLEEAPGAAGGATQLSELSDVNTSTPTNRNALIADGVDWESRAIVEADISDLGSYITDVTGDNLSALADVTITTIASGELLKWNGTAWINNTLAEAGVAAASHTHATSDVTSGTFADARIAESNVTQHQAALTLTESQVESALTSATAFTANNYVFNVDQTVGAGQDNYVLTYDNATGEIGLEVNAGGGLADIVDDTTPQLGGSLDVNGNKIVSVSNGNIDIEPHGTGNVLLGNMTFDADQTIGAGQDNYVLTYDNGTGLISLEASSGGATQLSDLSDVNTSTATNRNVLVADGVDFESRALVEADISDLGSYITDVTGDNLSALADVTITAIASGEILKWNGSAWINNTLAEAGVAAASHTHVEADITDLGAYITASSTDTLTNKTFDANGTGNSLSNVDVADLANGTDGELITWSATGTPTTVAVGTSGHVLTSNGVGAAPTFQAAAGGASQLTDLSDVNTATVTNRFCLVADGVDFESRLLVEADISDLGSYITDVTGDNLSALADVTITGIASGELLKWNGSAWVNNTLAEAGVAAASHTHVEADITDLGAYITDVSGDNLGTLADVTITGIASGEILKWNGSAWINNTLAEAGIQASGSYLSNVSEDTTPQLGGSLDVNGNKIVSVSNGNIDIEPHGTGNVLLGNFTLDADQTIGAGQDNYVLTYDNGTGLISLEVAPGAAGGIDNVVEDTTPQLGGSLDVNGNKIVSVTNGDIDIEPNGTGNVLLGNFTFDADQTVGAGQDNYVLTYDNATGNISLEAAAGGGLSNIVEDVTPQLGADLEMQGFNLQSGGVIMLSEQAAADADVAGEGQIWVKSDAPNELYFTDDTGLDWKFPKEQIKYKTATTSTSTDTTFTDDPHLAGFNLENDTWYMIEGYIELSSALSVDIKFRGNLSQTEQAGSWTLTGRNSGGTNEGDHGGTIGSSTILIDTNNTNNHGMVVAGYIHSNATTGGTFAVEWAQNTSSASTTSVLLGSWLKLTKLS